MIDYAYSATPTEAPFQIRQEEGTRYLEHNQACSTTEHSSKQDVPDGPTAANGIQKKQRLLHEETGAACGVYGTRTRDLLRDRQAF